LQALQKKQGIDKVLQHSLFSLCKANATYTHIKWHYEALRTKTMQVVPYGGMSKVLGLLL
jgi:hypothetical protein